MKNLIFVLSVSSTLVFTHCVDDGFDAGGSTGGGSTPPIYPFSNFVYLVIDVGHDFVEVKIEITRENEEGIDRYIIIIGGEPTSVFTTVFTTSKGNCDSGFNFICTTIGNLKSNNYYEIAVLAITDNSYWIDFPGQNNNGYYFKTTCDPNCSTAIDGCFCAGCGIREDEGFVNWSYLDYVIPEGLKIDSIYADFSRPDSEESLHDFVFQFSAETTEFDVATSTTPFNHDDIDTSMYNIWMDLTSYGYSNGVVRISLPQNEGAIWNDLCFATSPLE